MEEELEMEDLIATKKEIKEESYNRLKKLGVMGKVARDFKGGKINVSEMVDVVFQGALFYANDEVMNKIHEIENEYGGMVYHVIHHRAEFGECYCLLYTSKYLEDWENDRLNMADNVVFAYVWNKSCDDWSEFGNIQVMQKIGGLIRIA